METKDLMELFLFTGEKYISICRSYTSLTKKDYAKKVQEFPKFYHPILYLNYDRYFSMKAYTSNWSINKWKDILTTFESLNEKTKDIYK